MFTASKGGAAASAAAAAAAVASAAPLAPVTIPALPGEGMPPPPQYISYRHATTMLACYNHKGGVAKTCTAFELGWSMAARGLRVLLVDADPQMSLTQLALQRRVDMAGHTWDSFLASRPEPAQLNAALRRYDSDTGLVVPYTVIVASFAAPARGAAAAGAAGTRKGRQGGELRLLMGDENLDGEDEFEDALKDARASMMLNSRAARNTPGAMYHLALMTAHRHNSQVVIFDLSPGMGDFNRVVLCSSAFFVVPCLVDYFSARAVNMLTRKLSRGDGPTWAGVIRKVQQLRYDTHHRALAGAAPGPPRYDMPEPRPVFAGTIITRFNMRGGGAPSALQSCISDVKRAAAGLFQRLQSVPPTGGRRMVPPDAAITAVGLRPDNLVLAEMPDFTSLSAFSQFLGVPAPFLDLDMVEQLCKWSARAGKFYGTAAWFNYQGKKKKTTKKAGSDFPTRIADYHARAGEATERLLRLMSASLDSADHAQLIEDLTTAATAKPGAATLPALDNGPLHDTRNPFDVFLDDDGALERQWEAEGAHDYASAVAVGRIPVAAGAAAGVPHDGDDGDEDEGDEDEGDDDEGGDDDEDDDGPGGAAIAARTRHGGSRAGSRSPRKQPRMAWPSRGSNH
jgi:cellulose biosynthesis protein BcsQ